MTENTPESLTGLARFSGITLVLGGARSGKSRFGESLARTLDDHPCYLATAQARDEEMRKRIERHRLDRGEGWRTLEEPLEIAGHLPDQGALLVDCLTLWLSNLMERDRDIDRETEKLCAALGKTHGNVILIANEVGLGIVPDNALARAFRDHAGRLNQRIAEIADHVIFVAAGLPQVLKYDGRPTWGEKP